MDAKARSFAGQSFSCLHLESPLCRMTYAKRTPCGRTEKHTYLYILFISVHTTVLYLVKK